MKKKTNLTIVIVTYLTNRKILLDCLKSIDKDFKVIIVENSKQFKDKKFFLKKFNNIEIVCTGLNLGYGKGNNFGLEKVQTDYALILNPDVVCKNDFFDKINKKKIKILLNGKIKIKNLKNKEFIINGKLKKFDIVVSTISPDFYFNNKFGELPFIGRDFHKIVFC